MPSARDIADAAEWFKDQSHRREKRHELPDGLFAVDDLEAAIGQHAEKSDRCDDIDQGRDPSLSRPAPDFGGDISLDRPFEAIAL